MIRGFGFWTYERLETNECTLKNQETAVWACTPDRLHISPTAIIVKQLLVSKSNISFCPFFSNCNVWKVKLSGGRSGDSSFRHACTSPGVPRLRSPLIKAKRGTLWHRPLFVHGLDAMTVVGKKTKMNEGWLVTWLDSWMPPGLFGIAAQATKWKIISRFLHWNRELIVFLNSRVKLYKLPHLLLLFTETFNSTTDELLILYL